MLTMAKRLKRLSVIEHVFSARFPGDLWAKLEQSAKASGYSINAELMTILKKHFAAEGSEEVPAKAESKRGKRR
jgi:hypothetical protein